MDIRMAQIYLILRCWLLSTTVIPIFPQTVPSPVPTWVPSLQPNLQTNWNCSSYSFLPSVETECISFPNAPSGQPVVRVKLKDMVDYTLTYALSSVSASQLYVELVAYPPQIPEFIGIQTPTSSEFANQLWGVAIDGVPIYSSLSAAGIDSLQNLDDVNNPIRVDYCGGSFAATKSDGSGVRYHYRAMPTCVLTEPVAGSSASRAKYVSDIYTLMGSFTGVAPAIVGYTLTGYPIYSPYNARGLLQDGLDNCNGKFSNGSYGYYVTPTFPYIIGCFGPGVYDSVQLGVTQEEVASTVGVRYKPCPGGFYPGRGITSGDGCTPCPAGTYSTVSYNSPRVSAVDASEACNMQCPIGFYCPSASTKPLTCPGGTFGSEMGLGTAYCSGKCREGYFCPEGSIRPTQYPCGNVTFFCPEGSSIRSRVDQSFYTIPEDVEESLRSGQMSCAPGSYCDSGRRFPCPSGRFGSESNLLTANCTGICPVGHYCPLSTVQPLPCPAGTYGAELGLTNSSCSGLCPKGYWCPLGSVSATGNPCPAGQFGSEEGLMTEECGQICEQVAAVTSESSVDTLFCSPQFCGAGYYCPEASTSAMQMPCGGRHLYCPSGSAAPTPVTEGFYTIGRISVPGAGQISADEMYRTGQQQCEPSYWCGNGTRNTCLAGYFGSDYGMRHSNCSGVCAAGYYCAAASTSARQRSCGDPGYYCPSGSHQPTSVLTGYYSTGGTLTTRTGIAICPAGSYCLGGLNYPCPAGRYSSSAGAHRATCDGACTAGYYCPLGSSSSTAHPCPAGRYGSAAGMVDSACEGICSAGYYCPAASTSSRQNACGGESFYCPAGSGAPHSVNSTYFSTGGTSLTRHAQTKCTSTICPSTTVA